MARERPDDVAALYQGATRVRPGLYLMPNGNCIFNVTEVLDELGFEDTPGNRALVADEITTMMADLGKQIIMLGGDK